MSDNRSLVYRVAFSGLMLSLAIVLSFVEGSLPALPMLPAGVKLGLSNIVTMYAVLFLGAGQAVLIALLKAFFVLLTRGMTGAFLSALGGVLSVLVMFLLGKIWGLSPLVLSIGGAVTHNFGQLVGAFILLQNRAAFYYAPVLVLSGIVMGSLTGFLLRFVAPYLRQIEGRCNRYHR